MQQNGCLYAALQRLKSGLNEHNPQPAIEAFLGAFQQEQQQQGMNCGSENVPHNMSYIPPLALLPSSAPYPTAGLHDVHGGMGASAASAMMSPAVQAWTASAVQPWAAGAGAVGQMQTAGAELLPGVRVQASAGFSIQRLEGCYVQDAAQAAAGGGAVRTYNSVPASSTSLHPPLPAVAAAGAGRVVEQVPPAAIAEQEVILASELQPWEFIPAAGAKRKLISSQTPLRGGGKHQGLKSLSKLKPPPAKRSRNFNCGKGSGPKPPPRNPAKSRRSVSHTPCLGPYHVL
jgi:hypothetical protein